jgi:TRAP-type C4-dicarboxylate transport system permease small subunit
MSEAVDTAPEAGALGWLGRLSRGLAIAGGIMTVAIALMVTTSVLLRGGANFVNPWSVPLGVRVGAIPGDFEIVQMVTALAAFAFLPWCQARRGNVIVDTFTTRLPKRAQAGLDAVWDVVYSIMMALIAWRLAEGAADAIRSHTTTMVLLVPVGPAIAGCAVMALFLAVIALATAYVRVTARQ